MATTVQFWGKDAVLRAYDSREVDTWAIFTGKEMITRGTGREDLSTFLSMLSEGFSNAVYTLKIYDNLDEAEVKDNTPCDGSFRFSISSNGVALSGSGGNDVLLAKIAALEKKLAEPEPETIGSAITGAFIGMLKDNPMGLVHLINGVKGLLGFNVPQMAAGVPGISAGHTEEILESDPGTRDRLVKALDILGKNDPKFVEHLEKLASISEKSPETFRGLLTMLSNF